MVRLSWSCSLRATRQVICEATPAMVDQYAATPRGKQSGMLERFAARIRALRVAAAGPCGLTRSASTGHRRRPLLIREPP